MPLPKDFGRFITFNDHAMNRVLGLLQDVAHDKDYAFVDSDRRAKAKEAFQRGVDLILKLQIKQDGKLTGWAQQYDPDTLQPGKARTYELPSLATDETVGIVRLLMSIDKP
jgi:PelA/Pel-15E family pectate lyase